MKLTPETWKQIEPLLVRGLDLTPEARASWLDSLRATDPQVAPLLAQMLATHERAERAQELETVPKLAPRPGSVFAEGDAVGPYRLLRPIGRGGMGEVWLAAQADGRMDREVALKLPTSLEAGDIRAERFRRERDILAKLVHPHIARLYDAGASRAGQPYLAMEHVEGVALDAYVAREKPDVPARLALFRQVLAAVAHAHRFLVVHRDVKPANILIDGHGQVKLLDFGIAKLVEDESVEVAPALTRLGGRVLTLRYAAPEQVAEGTITTATDIYSLGVVLHELLTGASPYKAVREEKPLTDLMLLQEEIARPSTLAKGLDADLDAIVLKALRRDPAERYATVEAFDDDIRRHLEHRPVHARAGTWRYLAGRFARRHRLPIAMAAAVMVTMAVGLVVAESQRREAERERQIALAERARAEKHFASVRKLANTFIFDVNKEIENLAGSLKARGMLLKTSIDYLDGLAAEGANDPALAVEVASGYRRLAEISGDVYSANLGDAAGALRNARKAQALLEPLAAARPADLALHRERLEVSRTLARLIRLSDVPASIAQNAAGARIAEHLAAQPGATRDDRRRLAAAWTEEGFDAGKLDSRVPEGLALLNKAREILETLAAEDPKDEASRVQLAGTYQRLGVLAQGLSGREEVLQSIAWVKKALAVNEALATDHPENATYARNLSASYAEVALRQGKAGDFAPALDNIKRAIERARALSVRYPEDSGARVLFYRALVIGSSVGFEADRFEESIANGQEAIKVHDSLSPELRKSSMVRSNLSKALGYVGLSKAGLGMATPNRLPTARRLQLLREGRSLLEEVITIQRAEVAAGIEVEISQLIIRQVSGNIAEIDAAIRKLGG